MRFLMFEYLIICVVFQQLQVVKSYDKLVRIAFDSNCRCFVCSGMDLSKWRELVETKGVPADMAKFTSHMQSHSLPNSVIIDCTASARVAEKYYEWVKKGIHIITPNKKANSGPFDQVLLSSPSQ